METIGTPQIAVKSNYFQAFPPLTWVSDQTVKCINWWKIGAINKDKSYRSCKDVDLNNLTNGKVLLVEFIDVFKRYWF